MPAALRLKRAFARQGWPDPGADLLIKAMLLPREAAQRAWRNWLRQNDIDHCSWPQMKILARLSSRLPDIDPGCGEIPRLNGLAKALWTQSQLRLNKATVALDSLSRNGIPVCLIKTAAIEAMGIEKSTRRVTSDLDVIVRRRDLRNVIELLFAEGWTSTFASGPAAALERLRYHPGINLERGHEPGGAAVEIDVHHQPMHMPFLEDGTLDALWSSARPATFRGRQVLVPPLEDHLAFTAIQGTRRVMPGYLSSGMWAFDLAEGIAQPGLDADRLLMAARRYSGVWPLFSCLEYLRAEIGLPIDASMMERLARDATGWEHALTLYAQAPTWGSLWPLQLVTRELTLKHLYRRFCAKGWESSKQW